MSYLDDVAATIESRVPPGYLPNEDTAALFRLYAVLALAKGMSVTGADVHNAWSAWMQERNPEHDSIKPYDDLDPDMKASDEPFVAAIRQATEGF